MGSFYLSPLVDIQEVDLSTMIPAVATSIGVTVLRQTYKGPEYEQTLVTTDEQLKDKFGYPTSTTNCYEDILSAMGFLKYGTSLYCTRVMPEDATFADTVATSGYNATAGSISAHYTFDKSGSVDASEDDGPYTYTSLGTTDTTQFADQVRTTMSFDEPLWFIASSRGNWGNNVRLLIADKDLYNSIRYYNSTNDAVDLPSGVTVTEVSSAAASSMYSNYSTAFNVIDGLDSPPTSDYQMVIVVQAKDQGESNWETKETYVVSVDETETNDQGESIFIEHIINETSDYIRVALNNSYKKDSESDNTDGEGISIGTENFFTLENGKNGVFGRDGGVSAQTAEDSIVIEAFELYDNAEEIDVNLFIDSNKGISVKRELITICETDRKDCMAVLDVEKADVLNNKGSEAVDIVKWRKGQSSTFNPNTSYAALYGNWCEVLDKWNKKYRWIPMSGHVTGLYVNTDNVADTWWAPAGLNRAILTGVRRLAWNPTKGERDILYKNGINPIVSFSGQGKVVWGQKLLLDKSSAFNRVNVRRLFLTLEKSISTASKYFIFEQNDEVTWMLMTNMIEPFLRDVKGRRGLYDFLVQIDENTNTPERMDREELWGNIFLKPIGSAEFIRLNFIATKTGADFSELADALNP